MEAHEEDAHVLLLLLLLILEEDVMPHVQLHGQCGIYELGLVHGNPRSM
jgi:hypothetical protein